MKIIYVIFLACTLVFGGCKKNETPFSSEVYSRVSNGEGTIIDINKFTSFNWDKLYIFKPYCTIDIIHETIKMKFLKKSEMQMGVPEGDTFLVFMEKGKVIKSFMHPRSYGDFSDFNGQYLLVTPNNAIFKVMHEDYSLHGKWYKLRHIEAQSTIR